MKRGLIVWDKSELPPQVFETRVNRVRRVLAAHDVPAMLVYSDLWRSNQARFFSNYMPYFNRALLIVPLQMPPTLLCGLSPRVYGWIRSVTTIEDVRPVRDFGKSVFELARERLWTRLGVLDLEQLPWDIHKALHTNSLDLTSIPSDAVFSPAADETELLMRRKAAAMAEEILKEEMPRAVGVIDYEFVGTLERRFRRAGAEDLIVLVTNGQTVPAPPKGARLDDNFSVCLAIEYRGHWVRISRPHAADELLRDIACIAAYAERLDGSYPYEIGDGSIGALHREYRHNGKRLFYGSTSL